MVWDDISMLYGKRIFRRHDAPRDPAPTITRRHRLRRAFVLLSIAVLIIAGAAVVLERVAVAPRLLALYVERRTGGHNAAVESAGRRVARWLLRADRGQPLAPLDVPAYSGAQPDRWADVTPGADGQSILVATEDDLFTALDRAQSGDVITLLPGVYRFDTRTLQVNRAGTKEAPIVVRAAALGTVRLEFALLEGFLIAAPYWRFENLSIRGVCVRHDDCEHAFHVVGAAEGIVIRNCDVRDFNAHVKINGHQKRFPDGGRIEANTFGNGAPRHTGTPVTPIDLVGASGWRIERNLIFDFVKDGDDYTSYGAFAKGGGDDNAFRANIVLCEHRLRGTRGRRVGLSFGGGGTDPAACRDERCLVEHDRGLLEDNLIVSCSDDGVYLNRASRTRLLHNTLIDTAGIAARYPETTGDAVGNLVDGPLRIRDGATLEDRDNRTTALALLYVGWHPVRRLFADVETLDLRWADAAPTRRADLGHPDLCGNVRAAAPAYGAFDDFLPCLRQAMAAR